MLRLPTRYCTSTFTSAVVSHSAKTSRCSSSSLVSLTAVSSCALRFQTSYYYKPDANKNFIDYSNRVHYDEETNTTTIPPHCQNQQKEQQQQQQQQQQDKSQKEREQEDAADVDSARVITASFGVQENIRPCWSFTNSEEVEAAAEAVEQQKNEKDNNNNHNSNELFSHEGQQEGSNSSSLPTMHKETVDPSFSLTPEEQQDVMREEIQQEIARQVPPVTNTQEDFMLEFQRYFYKKKAQVGPYIGQNVEKEEKERGSPRALKLRTRREIERVPQWEPPFEAAETSFRRLPPSIKIPSERQLRHLYPMKTDLPIKWNKADCADMNLYDIEEDPAPMKFGVLYPKNYDPRKAYPTLVWLADNRGEEVDFEDCCAHLFGRQGHYESWYENGWVIYCPCIAMKHSQLHPQEGVVARFCDWVVQNNKVENNRVHLGGKGLGGFSALRTVLEVKHLAISCTALLGRLAGPYRPLEQPQEKAHNINGTHVLMYVPGDMRKTEYVYKFKGFCDLAKVRPAVRAVHFADIRDHQVYYAVNSAEFWNYLEYFRTHNLHQPVVL